MVTYTRKLILLVTDIFILNVAYLGGLYIRFDSIIPLQYIQVYTKSIIYLVLIKIILFYIFGLYRSLWQFASIAELIKIFNLSLVGVTLDIILGILMDARFPRSVYIMSWFITFVFVGGARLSYRLLRRARKKRIYYSPDSKRVMVIGAGDAGAMVIKEMKEHPELGAIPVVVVDDDRWKQRTNIHGVNIKGDRSKIKKLCDEYDIDEIILAIPSANRKDISDILKICSETGCKLKTLPGVYELIDGKTEVKKIRDVKIEDLLGRDEVKLDTSEVCGYIKDEVVLVTGGGGSIGSELCRQIASFEPKKLLIFDIYENNAYELQNELVEKYNDKLDLEVIIGSVRDKKRLIKVFQKYRPGVVFHAAAHKHVPLMESNPEEAVKNNILGTLNTAQCADHYMAKRFVLISTDKAVNPTNIMGASKRVCEMIIQSIDKTSKTEFTAVRFGNVLGSNGSVIPIFKKQIENGGPVTVTHPNITRYFMTIPEATRLVIQAGAMAKGGEIFVLDMGDPVKIMDLAKDIIKLSGYRPGVDIKIKITGLRPGEKLYEELLMSEEGLTNTEHDKIFIGRPSDIIFDEVLQQIEILKDNMHNRELLKDCLERIVPTYKRPQHDEVIPKKEEGILRVIKA